MLQGSRIALETALGEIIDWNHVDRHASIESVAPDESVRAVGDVVDDLIVVECGLFAVTAAGQPPQWAPAGAVIGIAASLSNAVSTVAISAVRFGRIARIPMRAVLNQHADLHAPVSTIVRMAQCPDHALRTLPPDPLVITALLENCEASLETTILSHLQEAVDALAGWKLVLGYAITPASVPIDAGDLAKHELNAQTVVYVVRSSDGDHAAALVAHADRVVVFQPSVGSAVPSAALTVACDDSARRHTELVVAEQQEELVSRQTRPVKMPPRVKRIHLLPAPSTGQLQALLTEVRSGARDIEALRDFHVFAKLSDEELAWVQPSLRWERLDGGNVLLHQGEKTEAVWLLRAGRLEEVRTTPDGERHVSWCHSADSIGVESLLSGGRRTTSVRAVRDSTVARLDRHTFETLLARSAGFATTIAQRIATRIASNVVETNRHARFFAVLPLTQPARVDRFVEALESACDEAALDVRVVDAACLNAALGQKASSTRRGDAGDGDIIQWLDRLERLHDVVILVGSEDLDTWTRRAIRQCDHLLVVADGIASPELRPIELELAREVGAQQAGSRASSAHSALGLTGVRHLVLLQPAAFTEAAGTSRWLALRPQTTHHHVRAGARSDVARLARRLTGRAVALALSGASSRAPAHFGVVRAMDDLGLPVDIASGSSSGAGIAALLAAGLRAEEGLASAIQIIMSGAPRMSQFQPPITALTSGAAADESLQAVFGNRQLEDQLIPAVLTAVDIRRHRAVHLTRGPLWKLVRASGSLPLLWPPVWHEDDLLVDGGILNYLPAEVFGDQADNGLIIASNLDAAAGKSAPSFTGTLEYGTVLNSWKQLAHRMSREKSPPPPAIIDILFHSMAIPSFQQQEGLAALAERDNVCVLTPTLGSFGLFEVNAEIGRQLEAAAWEHARHELKRVAALWHSRLEWRVPK